MHVLSDIEIEEKTYTVLGENKYESVLLICHDWKL
jgi:hypothetical protein